jgi:transcriptional regulator with XRE-family HTH domain
LIGVSDPKAYVRVVEARQLLAAVRAATGLTQEAVARRAGTTQPTLSAYERGQKSPSLAVTERILQAMGYELDVTPRVVFERQPVGVGGRSFFVPDRLWRLDPSDCYAPLRGRHSPTGRPYLMDERRDRLNAYAWLLEHGAPEELLTRVDGVLLIDAWPEIAPSLHPTVRNGWWPLIAHAYEAQLDAELIASLRAVRPRQPGRRALKRAVVRMVDRGLTYDEIARVLQRRR